MSIRPRYPALLLLAFIGAVMLWYAVASERREQISVRSFKVPVSLVYDPSVLVLISPAPEEVTIQLRGPLSQSSSAEPPTVFIDLSDAVPGRRSYPIVESNIKVPENMSVVSFDPKEVELELERKEVATLPVQPVFEGDPAPGFLMTGFRVTPPQVRVQGPGSQLADLEVVTTSPVSIEGLTSSVETTVSLGLTRPLESLQAGQVVVLVEISPKPTPTPATGR